MPASIKHLTDRKVNYYSLLARWKDGLYYTAALLNCDKANKRCLVCFEDGSELWANNRDLHIQLSLDQLDEDEDIVCCICDDGKSEAPNEIILCDICQQGYHQKCHKPAVDSSTIDESEDTKDHKDWICATCAYILNQTKLNAAALAQQQHDKLHQSTPTKSQAVSSSASGSAASSSQEQKHQAASSRLPPSSHLEQRPHHTNHNTSSSSSSSSSSSNSRETTKVKQQQQTSTPPVTSQQQNQKQSPIGPVKQNPNQSQRSAPYYPLSSQVRASASSSTAALASMTASSALVVGSSSGRTKQDLVNQSNRSSQRQQRQISSSASANNQTAASNPSAIFSTPPKHAVRKSSVNFGPASVQQLTPPPPKPPVKQSALPTAVRSTLTSPSNIPSTGHHTIPIINTLGTTTANLAQGSAARLEPPSQMINTSSMVQNVATKSVKNNPVIVRNLSEASSSISNDATVVRSVPHSEQQTGSVVTTSTLQHRTGRDPQVVQVSRPEVLVSQAPNDVVRCIGNSFSDGQQSQLNSSSRPETISTTGRQQERQQTTNETMPSKESVSLMTQTSDDDDQESDSDTRTNVLVIADVPSGSRSPEL